MCGAAHGSNQGLIRIRPAGTPIMNDNWRLHDMIALGDAAGLIVHINNSFNEFAMFGLLPSIDVDRNLLSKQFRLMSRVLHPDKFKNVGATEAFKKMSDARDKLENPSDLPGIIRPHHRDHTTATSHHTSTPHRVRAASHHTTATTPLHHTT